MNERKFFVIEGVDGAGKSTQILRLRAHFGNRITTTREPGGCPRAELIRTELFTHKEWSIEKQFEEFWRARGYHFEDKIIPSLDAGYIVVSDRLDSSTWAYQMPEKHENRAALVRMFWEMRHKIMREYEPTCYIYLDLPVEVGLARKTGQGEELNHFDQSSLEVHLKRQRGYMEFFQYVPHKVIDASKSEDEVTDELVAILES